MADPTTLPELSTIPPGVSITSDPTSIADTGSALDALFKPIDSPSDEPKLETAAAPVEPTTLPPAAIEPKPGAGADKTAASTPPPTPEVAKDEFEGLVLPPHTKSEVATSFESLKKTSREKVAAAQKEREELAARVKELETRPAIDPKLEAELKELRDFRAKMDVEADPTFKEYVEESKANEESIWAKLKEAGASEDALKKMKDIGAKDLDWEIILEKLPPVTRRYVENKLAVNEDLNDQRTRHLESAKKNATEFLAERQKASTQDELAHYAKAEEHFGKVSVQLPWFKLQKAEATATPEQKAAVDAENKFFIATQDQVTKMLKDPSPEMRSIAALGYAQMLRLQAEIPALQAEHAAEKKALDEKIAKLEATVKEKEDFIARVKGASRTSLRDGGATSDPAAAAAQPTFAEHGSVAVDRLRAQQLAGS
jgi:hypothetical protein